MIRADREIEGKVHVEHLTDKEAPVVWDGQKLVVKPGENLEALRDEAGDLVIEGVVYSS